MRSDNWPLSEIVREILLGDEEHQRIEVYGREIVSVIPDLQLEFDNQSVRRRHRRRSDTWWR